MEFIFILGLISLVVIVYKRFLQEMRFIQSYIFLKGLSSGKNELEANVAASRIYLLNMKKYSFEANVCVKAMYRGEKPALMSDAVSQGLKIIKSSEELFDEVDAVDVSSYDLKQCRKQVSESLMFLVGCGIESYKTKGSDWEPWFTEMHKAHKIIEDNPEDIPIICYSVYHVVEKLEWFKNHSALERGSVYALGSVIAPKVLPMTKRLLEIHGHSITSAEEKRARNYISSYKHNIANNSQIIVESN